MEVGTSTTYPHLQPVNPTQPSLADLPLEIILQILEALFAPAQIIPIEIFGPHNPNPAELDLNSTISKATMVVLRPPPLSIAEATTCRLFRLMYLRSRPEVWGDHLHTGKGFHIDLSRDIFHVRIHRTVHYREWDHDLDPTMDPLEGILKGIKRMATSVNYISPIINEWGGSFLRHLNPQFRELMVLVPARGVERGPRGGLKLAPVLRPLGMSEVIRAPVSRQCQDWGFYHRFIVSYLTMLRQVVPPTLQLREIWRRTWRLGPVPLVEGYLVDERRLNDPNAFGLDR